MEYRECNKRIITNLKYNACREYDKRGPRQSDIEIFVGYHPDIKKHIAAISYGKGAEMEAAIRLLGSLGVETKEKLIDQAMILLDTLNGKLTVFPEPGYAKPR